jgi:hypothetical protein
LSNLSTIIEPEKAKARRASFNGSKTHRSWYADAGRKAENEIVVKGGLRGRGSQAGLEARKGVGIMNGSIRKMIRPSITIVCVLMLTRLASAAPDTASIRTQIAGMPVGTSIELRLKDKQKLRGARGTVSDFGFTLVDARSGERQIAFDNVASVKQVKIKSHTARNILIGVGIGVGAVAIVIVALARSGGYL